MVDFKLSRYRTGENGTFGYLCWDEQSLTTLELPWNDGRNRHDTDAILPGVYEMLIDYSHRLEEPTPLLLDVPNRVSIRMHNGNTTKDTFGCILVGENEAVFGGVDGVANSKKALAQIMEVMNDDMNISTLTITNGFA